MPDAPLPDNKLLSPQPPKHGSTVGIIIVIFILLAGGLYFALVRLQEQRAAASQIPYIQSGTTTITVIEPTSTAQ